MNQDVINLIKEYLNEFPNFLKSFLKKPISYIDNEPNMDWIKVLLYGFLVEAITNTAYSIGVLHISGIAASLIFSPIQTLIVIAFLSFIVWFILDRIGFSQIQFLSIFKIIVFSEIIISVFAMPIMIVLAHIKSLDLIYIMSALIILGKSYLVYRGFTGQLQLANKRALMIVGVFTVFFIAPVISNFFDGFSMRQQIRDNQRLHEIQMEQSIEELEKELGGE